MRSVMKCLSKSYFPFHRNSLYGNQCYSLLERNWNTVLYFCLESPSNGIRYSIQKFEVNFNCYPHFGIRNQ